MMIAQLISVGCSGRVRQFPITYWRYQRAVPVIDAKECGKWGVPMHSMETHQPPGPLPFAGKAHDQRLVIYGG